MSTEYKMKKRERRYYNENKWKIVFYYHNTSSIFILEYTVTEKIKHNCLDSKKFIAFQIGIQIIGHLYIK